MFVQLVIGILIGGMNKINTLVLTGGKLEKGETKKLIN